MNQPRPAESAVDRLARAALVVDPPPELQARIRLALAGSSWPAYAAGSNDGWPAVRLVAYLFVGIAIAAYASLVASIPWDDVAAGVLQAAWSLRLVVAFPAFGLPSDVVAGLDEGAVWLFIPPLVWYLWDRDRRDSADARSVDRRAG